VDKSNKLLFFNKEGYPYNFQYDKSVNEWGGKLIFDENSSELFKTIGLYVFEQVDPIYFEGGFCIEPSQLYNVSGMTFVQKTIDNDNITNIEKVNNDINFYTKWIYGDRFNEKFKRGSIITINDPTESINGNLWNDFLDTDNYFNVLSTKKDAILIGTKTSNYLFNGFVFVTGATVSSHNIIKIPDYGEQHIDMEKLNYYDGKKISIVNSYKNDGVFTFRNRSKIKNRIYDFNLSSHIIGDLNIQIDLLTERPKLYSGFVNIEMRGMGDSETTITFGSDINNDIDFFNTGQTIIFETYDGNGILNPNTEFIINGYKDKDLLLTEQLTFIEIDGRNFIIIDIPELSGLTFVDQIYLEADPVIVDETTGHGRYFDVMNVYDDDTGITTNGIKIEVEQYVIDEYGNIYNMYKMLKRSQVQTIYVKQSSFSYNDYSGNVNCFATTNKLNFTQEILVNDDSEYYYKDTVDSLNIRYSNYLETYGIQIYHHVHNNIEYLMIEGLYDYNYNPYFHVLCALNDTLLLTDDNFILIM